MSSSGLAGVEAGESAICTVGLGTGLNYRGFKIEDLCENCIFEEVAYLLIHEKLPTKAELAVFMRRINAKRVLPDPLKKLLELLPVGSHPMDVLRTTTSFLGCIDNPVDMRRTPAVTEHFMAILPASVMYWYHFSHNKGLRIDTRGLGDDECMASHFLRLVNRGTREVPQKLHVKTVDISMICYAEHDFNASTFAARVTASTQSDIYSAITSAIGTLRGPLHGGANEAAMDMLASFKSVEDADEKIHEALAQKKLIMGFGHRIYKGPNSDPRNIILKRYSKLLNVKPNLFAISERVERILAEEKKMYPNADFYAASAYNQCGIPTCLFTPIFVFARTAGWAAHVIEQQRANKLIRPSSKYIGPPTRQFVKIQSRL
jgi:2-methylcitrate synthase